MTEQQYVNHYFHTQAAFWNALYSQGGLYADIHRERRNRAVRLARELGLGKEARILDIGCGAGWTSIALAELGYGIDAMDSVPAMVKLTDRNAKARGVDKLVRSMVGDVYELTFGSGTIDLVITLGVTPWLQNMTKALDEIHRVLRVGGYVILNADNRFRLNHLLDPLFFPLLHPLKRVLKRWLQGARRMKIGTVPETYSYSMDEFCQSLAAKGLHPIKRSVLGFGPFSFLGCNLLPDSIAVNVHRFLQRYADHGFPILRTTGSQFIMVARKLDSQVSITC